MIINKILKDRKNFYIILIVLIIFFSYYGITKNYFFSDDFEWISRAIISQAQFSELVKIHGRDFNPVFLVFLAVLIKIFGVSVFPIRLVFLILFAFTFILLFIILEKYLAFSPFFAFSSVVLVSCNVFVSEAILNLSASVYFLSLLFVLISLIFLMKKKIGWFAFFFIFAFLTKEIIFLTLIPIFIISERIEKKKLLFFGGFLILFRVLIQLSNPAQYTSFISKKHFLVKIYFILLRSANLSPYSINPIYGLILISSIIILIVIYMIKSEDRDKFSISIFAFWIVYTLFFAFLPKLSSRYILFPSMGLIFMYLRIFNTFSYSKIVRYMLSFLILISFVFNYPKIQKEIEDYKILGNFSRDFIEKEKKEIVSEFQSNFREGLISLRKEEPSELVFTYSIIQRRGNLPKLLPVRTGAIGGVIKPKDLIPLIFYPERIAKFEKINETNKIISGRIIFLR